MLFCFEREFFYLGLIIPLKLELRLGPRFLPRLRLKPLTLSTDRVGGAFLACGEYMPCFGLRAVKGRLLIPLL